MNTIQKSVALLWPSIRISLVLVLITMSLILVADMLEITPNHAKHELEKRKQLSETLAILFSTMIAESDIKKMRIVLSDIQRREGDVLSAGFRMQSGKLIFEIGLHSQKWGNFKGIKSTATHVLVPIYKGNKQYGTIELRFNDLFYYQGFNILKNPTYKLIAFVFCFGFLSFFFFILRTLREIDPSAVIPDRVNTAFDTLSEGLLILDNKEQILLANKAFAEIIKRDAVKLLGMKLSGLHWRMPDGEEKGLLFPWLNAISTGKSSVGNMLVLEVSANESHTFTINCGPIHDSQGKQQGILLTFDDVTEIEKQKLHLQLTVSDLKSSQNEIRRQNKELHFLATRDPMTGCLNRRSFNEQFAQSFTQARSQNEELTCLMVDIDHFKLVNDNYGHAVGDEVIKLLANVLLSCTRDEDIVSRYGGEEFCIILPGIEVDHAVAIAERIRLKIKNDSISSFETGPHITVSIGVASIYDHAKDPAELNDQADQALYVAKESGRNRVIRWTAESSDKKSPSLAKEINSEPDQRIALSSSTHHDKEIEELQVQIQQLEETASNVSDRLLNEQNYDKLTGLPSQALFYDRVKQAVEIAARNNQIISILIIDFDLFAQANNSYGLVVAENMFSILSERISTLFRKTDTVALVNFDANDVTISRFEGDTLGVLLSDLVDHTTVTWVIKRVLDALISPIVFEAKEIYVNCKMGVSIFPEDASSAEELLSHANTAKCFKQRNLTNNNFQFYDASMQAKSLKQIDLEVEIKRAIKNEEWVLYYQPKIDIATQSINSVEALIRWNHPERGILLPFEFIFFAEERGFIHEIGEWVLRTACKQAKAWSDKGLNITMAINLSTIQLNKAKLANQVLSIIQETQVSPQQVELEVTETMLMDNLEMAVKTLNKLHYSGVRISIDDFGTGYSSLVYLKHLPIDILKIDRLFIKDIVTDDYDKNIVTSIISMAHGMNLNVVAEGVETLEQYKLLQEMSCDGIQGYLFSKPIDVESATKLLEQETPFIFEMN